MCGIAGIINFQKKVDKADLIKMTNAIKHRGPDGEGHWINNDGNIGFGHRRLSIIDLSDKGHQPMTYLNNRYTITFNGEIYNYIEVKKTLEQKNYKFQSKTDTEVVLAAYDYWGKECVKKFDGMFAFAIWDELKKEIFCARDRFGEKPFYYYKDEDSFIFASEMKAIWALGIEKKKNKSRIFEYLLYSTLENPYNRSETFFENIKQIEPSQVLTIQDNQLQFETYWELTFKKEKISFEEASEMFKNLFETSLKRRFRSDIEVGSSLSGGLDSSAIVSLIYKTQQKKDFKTFSAIFPGYKKNEEEYIHHIINQTGFSNFTVQPDENSFLEDFDKLMHHQEEPFGSGSIYAQFAVMQLAAKNNTHVLLDGQGADEVLAGYNPTIECYLKSLTATPLKYKKSLAEFKKNQNFKLYRSEKKILAEGLLYNTIRKIGHQKRIKKSNNADYFLGIHKDLVKEFKDVKNPIYKPPSLKKHLHFLLFNRGLNELLRYADRNAMAHSVEVRLPFLDHKIVEFIFSLPDSYLLQGGWTKYILRHSMKGILPSEIQWRNNKIGFGVPQEKWLKNQNMIKQLKEAEERLLDEKFIQSTNDKLKWHYLMLDKAYAS